MLIATKSVSIDDEKHFILPVIIEVMQILKQIKIILIIFLLYKTRLFISRPYGIFIRRRRKKRIKQKFIIEKLIDCKEKKFEIFSLIDCDYKKTKHSLMRFLNRGWQKINISELHSFKLSRTTTTTTKVHVYMNKSIVFL